MKWQNAMNGMIMLVWNDKIQVWNDKMPWMAWLNAIMKRQHAGLKWQNALNGMTKCKYEMTKCLEWYNKMLLMVWSM